MTPSDAHKRESQVCILTEAGELIERRMRTEPQRFTEVLGDQPQARILIEAGTESEWWRHIYPIHPGMTPTCRTYGLALEARGAQRLR